MEARELGEKLARLPEFDSSQQKTAIFSPLST
jgi:hypothetical protein